MFAAGKKTAVPNHEEVRGSGNTQSKLRTACQTLQNACAVTLHIAHNMQGSVRIEPN